MLWDGPTAGPLLLPEYSRDECVAVVGFLGVLAQPLESPLPHSSLVPFPLPLWLMTQQVSATIRFDREAYLIGVPGANHRQKSCLSVACQGFVQLQQEEPRDFWGRATLWAASACWFCVLPELG